MSKVYVLRNNTEEITEGVVSKKEVAEQYEKGHGQYFIEVELNDPELLNRIAKESENKS